MQLYENAFSPFARKVWMVLKHKGLDFEAIDGLDLDQHARLKKVNGRAEVPALVDGDVCVVNSADIVAYLEHAYPDAPSVYPEDPPLRVRARAWERCADTTVDPLLINISYWYWADRADTMPDGAHEAARRDMNIVYDALNQELSHGDFVAGEVSVADFALWPHLAAVRMLGVNFDAEAHPHVLAWYKRLRAHPIFSADLDRAKAYLSDPSALNVERKRIFWRGDRIERLLAHGQHAWFIKEIEEDRVMWPGLAIPQPR